MLTTIDAVKEFLGGQETDKDDVRITSCLTRASAMIETYCNRTFAQTSYTEYYDGNGSRNLQLRNFPVIGTPTVLENGSALSVSEDWVGSSDVILRRREGLLVRPYFYWLRYVHYYKITYSAGFATVPDDIVDAAIELTLILLKEKERVGLSQHTTGAITSTYIRTLPKMTQATLDGYTDLVLGRAI